MADVNRVFLVGRLGRDPDVRTTQAGNDIVNLSLATSDRWVDKMTGEKRERTEWHRLVVFASGTAKFAKEHLRKGDLLCAEGSLRTRKWSDRDGRERFTTEVVVSNLSLLGRSGGGGGDGGGGGTAAGAATSSAAADPNDDIPFRGARYAGVRELRRLRAILARPGCRIGR